MPLLNADAFILNIVQILSGAHTYWSTVHVSSYKLY